MYVDGSRFDPRVYVQHSGRRARRHLEGCGWFVVGLLNILRAKML